ncbi:DUF7577 domain-containing protein [Halorussus amylolyticus]|uniref:DUF7577 domain-containing protein n=1 Tax=Halorussus amylolyticus TaxID=1126242 RepID=UPI001049B9C0|nr:hypothetical protein [Halorussus amylolyticus]
MDLAYRLLLYAVATVGPTLLFLGLVRFLEWLRDDALLVRIAESEDAAPNARQAAANAVEKRDGPPLTVSQAAVRAIEDEVIRTDGENRRSESVACPACGEANPTDVTYCQQCVGKLD